MDMNVSRVNEALVLALSSVSCAILLAYMHNIDGLRNNNQISNTRLKTEQLGEVLLNFFFFSFFAQGDCILARFACV